MQMNRQWRWLATIAVLAHLAVNLAHGQAHVRLGVGLAAWQQLFVIAVILVAPLVALGLSWTRFVKGGLWLLLLAMLGSLIFGTCYHYLIVSSDHVAHLPAGEARGLFRGTAALLVISEIFGVVVAAIGLRRQQ